MLPFLLAGASIFVESLVYKWLKSNGMFGDVRYVTGTMNVGADY
ncbi:hypothetical protein CES85_5321 [Ochrobactrum quorumnocens]|uniref:Uncharacterized protein n=1 Tax=Ochrobactrum quorumnocens TaxID=271865 RepID=A0A248UCX7_9HYPH|nr:hypothetical protein CES85_5321 [[Ochrobactrum] quorumnocens]